MTDEIKADAELSSPEEDSSRDARGRWQKGHCPNPKGRPRKRRNPRYDPSDVRHFMNTKVELVVNGEPLAMDRKAALLNKMFESAMKGRVSMQRHLLAIFDKNDAELSELRQQYFAFVHEWIIDNPDFVSIHESLSSHQVRLLRTMEATLNHYHPGQFEPFLPMKRDDGGALM